MTKDDIIRMAREANLTDGIELPHEIEAVERFAALVAAAEREACAKVCEPQDQHDDPLTAWKIATAIRARGQHD